MVDYDKITEKIKKQGFETNVKDDLYIWQECYLLGQREIINKIDNYLEGCDDLNDLFNDWDKLKNKFTNN